MAELKIRPVAHPDRIVQYWKREKLVVACIVVFGIGFNTAAVLSPVFQGRLIDSLVSGSSTDSVLRLALTFVSIVAAIQLMRYFKRFYIRRFANGTSASMRLMIYNNIMNRSTFELNGESTGNLMTRAISDVDLCVEGMRKFTTELFDTGVLMASYLVSLLVYDVRITLASIIFIPAAMLLAEKLKSIIYEFSIEYRRKSSEIADITYDAVENSMLYRISGMEAGNGKAYDNELEDLQNKAVRANILENSMQPVYQTIAMLGIIPVIYLGGLKVLNSGWTVGAFSAYLTMFAAMAVKAGKAAKLFNSVQKSQISWKRIKPYLSEYRANDNSCSSAEDRAKLSVENLCFSYSEDREPIIRDISFEAKQGEIIGITGSIASGKTTLGLSLLGLYPYSGSIRINGRELSDYPDSERSGMISYMGHRPQLLSDTIHNNIAMGADRDISAVLKDVCFDVDIAAMPDGQATVVGNGGIRLSGGQQARIALARALLEQKKIIVLDDPFSAVDMKTEEKIIENLRSRYHRSIIIIISHRLAIFDKIDHILLLNDDGTSEHGTHEELMRSSGLYSTIYGLQRAEGGDGNEKRQ